MKKRDLFWLFALPLYLVIGTIRHESGHAFMAMAQGAEILEFNFIPAFRGSQFYFGYVRWTGGSTNWMSIAAPYFLDLLTFTIFFVICYFGRFRHHWRWLNLMILGLVSPLVNSGYQYFKVGLSMSSDIGRLLEMLPAIWVHFYMIFTILLYLVGIAVLVIHSANIRDQKANS
jgi:hypothetical protein